MSKPNLPLVKSPSVFLAAVVSLFAAAFIALSGSTGPCITGGAEFAYGEGETRSLPLTDSTNSPDSPQPLFSITPKSVDIGGSKATAWVPQAKTAAIMASRDPFMLQHSYVRVIALILGHSTASMPRTLPLRRRLSQRLRHTHYTVRCMNVVPKVRIKVTTATKGRTGSNQTFVTVCANSSA